MKVYPRSRIVTFRVTEDEYQDIRAMCDGANNSVSDVARDAVIGPRGLPFEDIDHRLASLDQKLDEVLCLLQKKPGEPSDL